MTDTPHESGVKFGPWQGLELMLSYIGIQYAVSLSVYFAWDFGRGLDALLRHHRLPGEYAPPDVMAWATLLGFLVSALWALFYTRRHARPLLPRGEPDGIAWRAPRPQAFVAALAAALLAMAFAALMVKLMPPDLDKLNGPTSRLLEAPGMPRLVVTLLAVVGAPLVEEFVFRGVFFAALVRRLGIPLSGLITTVVFVALHAPDKLGWWPGFLVVGFLGVLLLVLRIRYRSLWPGMLTHCLYNSSFFFLS